MDNGKKITVILKFLHLNINCPFSVTLINIMNKDVSSILVTLILWSTTLYIRCYL